MQKGRQLRMMFEFIFVLFRVIRSSMLSIPYGNAIVSNFYNGTLLLLTNTLPIIPKNYLPKTHATIFLYFSFFSNDFPVYI